MYVSIDETGRICATTDVAEYAEGMQEFDFPDDFDFTHIGDYLIKDGALVYDGAQTAEEQAAEAAAEAAKAIEEEKNAFFAPGGGKSKMEQDIKDAAVSGGADPQLKALATLQIATMDLTSVTSTECVGFRDYWPEWQEGVSYKQNDCVRYGGKYWRVSQDTTSRGIYPPGTSESLYYEVELAPDGIIVYRTCHGQYDMVRAGEKRHYPDADGPVYRAKVDTAYDPDTVPGNWELVDGEPTEPDEGEITTEPEEPSDEPTEPTIPEFIQPTGAHDAYGIGDRVTYNGKVYESTMAGNVWSPDAYPQGWKLVE